MCIFSKPKSPSVVQAPAVPAPPPPPQVVAPTEVSAQSADESRRKRLERIRNGLAGTIKTGARGITGNGANLTGAGQTGRTRLGQ